MNFKFVIHSNFTNSFTEIDLKQEMSEKEIKLKVQATYQLRRKNT